MPLLYSSQLKIWLSELFRILELRNMLRSWRSIPHPAPVFVLGNQKSGTTAIASLLARASGHKATLDFTGPYRPLKQVLEGNNSINDMVRSNRYDFSKPVIKEPHLSLLYPELVEAFPKAKFVFIIRDPRDNIRSILNRLGLDGRGETRDVRTYIRQLGLHQNLTLAWQMVFAPPNPERNYIEVLSTRWLKIASTIPKDASFVQVVRYEDFLKSKKQVILDLAELLQLPVVSDIEDYLDIQYQPKGNHDKSWGDFFGERNLRRIENICEPEMVRFRYISSVH